MPWFYFHRVPPQKMFRIDLKKQDAAARAACHGTGKAML